MRADVVDLLRCPVCGDALGEAGGALRCAAGHSFDIARHYLLYGSALFAPYAFNQIKSVFS